MTEEKSKVAETLKEYRGQYAYNLLDEHYRRFAAQVPQLNQWDDHEVTNNWYPGEILDDARYTEKRVDVLAARAMRAYHEWVPTPESAGTVYRKLSYGPLLDIFVLDMRTFKDVNDGNTYADPDGGLLGAEQREWLINGLRRSPGRSARTRWTPRSGPEVVFSHTPPAANTSPAQGFQHFGEVEIDGRSKAFTVHLRDRDGVSLWTTTLPAP